MDPLQEKYPELTPYQFASNSPIQAIDLDGREEYHYTMTMDKQGKAVLNLAEPVKYSNYHSWFWGLYEFDTKIDVKRYIVDYDGNTYHIGFAQTGTGYGNAWKGENFENDYVKKQGDVVNFENTYVDDKQSQTGSDAASIVNAQNIGAETAIPDGEEDAELPSQTTNKAATAAHGGNTEAAEANAASQLPSTYNRVKPNKSTLKQVEQNQPRNENGEMIDPNTKKPLTSGQVDLGHIKGQEWRKRKAMHQAKGSTRKQVIKEENNPDLYQYEDRYSNRSHKHEEKK